MRLITIIYKRSRSEAADLALKLKRWLESLNILVNCQQNVDDSRGRIRTAEYPTLEMPADCDAIIVLGGDGTFLSVARFLDRCSTPVVGVNLGGLGFLTEIAQEVCFKEIERIVNGDYEIEERMRLSVSVEREDREVFRLSVLNDAVINKGALARIVDLKTRINGRQLTDYRADGLIVATPTGSTAYNLSAGGPIVYPTAQAIVLTPICPFTLSDRPIILPADVTLLVELGDPSEDVALTCDGQVGFALAPSDRIVITRAATPLRLIKPPSIDYFEILRTKLRWGQNS
ncbi:MAG: NAD(+)/NADH kinase [Syntrophobacteraceae bacterium]